MVHSWLVHVEMDMFYLLTLLEGKSQVNNLGKALHDEIVVDLSIPHNILYVRRPIIKTITVVSCSGKPLTTNAKFRIKFEGKQLQLLENNNLVPRVFLVMNSAVWFLESYRMRSRGNPTSLGSQFDHAQLKSADKNHIVCARFHYILRCCWNPANFCKGFHDSAKTCHFPTMTL